jgi:hypothetical protein
MAEGHPITDALSDSSSTDPARDSQLGSTKGALPPYDLRVLPFHALWRNVQNPTHLERKTASDLLLCRSEGALEID